MDTFLPERVFSFKRGAKEPGSGHERRWDVARLMQTVQGRFAEDYNRRKKRHGAFWSDRYHATMIDGGDHLWACLKYIELNMVRAGVVRHPREWEWTAWHELVGDRERYRLIDRTALMARLEGVSWGRFRKVYAEMIDEAVHPPDRLCREEQWTESIGVGRAAFVAGLEVALDNENRCGKLERVNRKGGTWILKETGPTLGFYARSRLEN